MVVRRWGNGVSPSTRIREGNTTVGREPFFAAILPHATFTETIVGERAMGKRKMARIGDGSALFSGLEGGTVPGGVAGRTAPLINSS